MRRRFYLALSSSHSVNCVQLHTLVRKSVKISLTHLTPFESSFSLLYSILALALTLFQI